MFIVWQTWVWLGSGARELTSVS